MSKVMTTDDLVRRVRSRGMVPSDTSTYTDEAIIEVLNDEMDTDVLAQIMNLNEEHLVTHVDIPLIDNVTSYKIPERAVANKLRDLAFLDTGNNIYEATRTSLEEISDSNFGYASLRDLPAFYIENNTINLTTSSLNKFNAIRMYFYLRPSRLISNKESAKITAINFSTGVISVSKVPENYTSLPLMDFVAFSSPNKIITYDKQVLAVSTLSNPNTITFNPADIPSDLKVGDFVSVAQESPVPNIPTEWHPYLAQTAIVQILESIGDSEGLTNAMRKLNKMYKDLSSITDNRVEGSPQKIKSRHNHISSRDSSRFRGR